MRTHPAPWLTAAVAALGLAAACSREAPTPNAELQPQASEAIEGATNDVQDGWITTKIQAKYFADADVKARRIDVTTENGVVTLTGTVENERARQQAVEIAKNTDGVVRVEDHLRPEAAATTGTAPEADPDRDRDTITGERIGEAASSAWITTKIQGKYFADSLVKARRIDVTTNNGVVTLTGTVSSPQEQQKAVEIARSTEGVRRVEDRLQVSAAGATAAPGTPGTAAPDRDATFTEQMSDAGITARVQSKFFMDDTVKARSIDVDTSGGVVTLQGQVTSEAERQQALSVARSVDGVRDVRDQLQVAASTASAPAGSAGREAESAIEDPWITTKIQSKYFMDDLVKAGQVGVSTSQGVVTLSGQVPSAEAKQRAEALAQQTDGVTRVENRLTVGTAPPQTSSATPPPSQ